MSAISGLLTGLNGIRDLAGSLINLRDAQVIATVQMDLTNRILEMQSQLSEVLAAIIEKDGTIAALDKRCRDLERKQADRERYQLSKLASNRDVFAYRLKPPSELQSDASELPHFLCQPCFDKGIKAVLIETDFYGLARWRCPVCKVEVSGDPH
jgi:hypothetical protein